VKIGWRGYGESGVLLYQRHALKSMDFSQHGTSLNFQRIKFGKNAPHHGTLTTGFQSRIKAHLNIHHLLPYERQFSIPFRSVLMGQRRSAHSEVIEVEGGVVQGRGFLAKNTPQCQCRSNSCFCNKWHVRSSSQTSPSQSENSPSQVQLESCGVILGT
jgi:hypothetical protein